MAWTTVEHNGKTYDIDIQNYFESVSTKEVVALDDLPAEEQLRLRHAVTTEYAKGFGYRRREVAKESAG